MTDATDVKDALTALRDVAENEAGNDNPDLKTVAEAYNKFSEAWVSKREADLKAEQDPDGANTDLNDDGEPQDAEAVQTKAVADAQPSTVQDAKPLRANKPVEVPTTKASTAKK